MHFMGKIQRCNVKAVGTTCSHYTLREVNVKLYRHERTIINLVVVRCLCYVSSCGAVIRAGKLRQTQSLKAIACLNN